MTTTYRAFAGTGSRTFRLAGTRGASRLPEHDPPETPELYLSPNTVKTHLRHACQKPGTHSRHEAVQRAWAIGLVTRSCRGGDIW